MNASNYGKEQYLHNTQVNKQALHVENMLIQIRILMSKQKDQSGDTEHLSQMYLNTGLLSSAIYT